MIITAFLVMIATITVVVPGVREPLPLRGVTALPNSPAVREHAITVPRVGAYQYVPPVLTATLVSEGMGKQKPGLLCHHAGDLSSTDCQPTSVWANEMRWRTGLMIEVLSRLI